MLLSIVIPSYNHGQFILSTISAASRVAIHDKEIIVIDDGSSDQSVRLVRDYSAQGNFTNLKLIARENRGLVKTLNEALSIAEGRLVYLVASDDIPIPEGVTHLVQLLEENPGMQFIMGNGLVMYSDEQRLFRPTYGEEHRRFFTLSDESKKEAMFFKFPEPLLVQSTVFRTACLRSIGGWREDLVLDDQPLFIKLLTRFSVSQKDFAFRPDIPVCRYRQHPSNYSRNLSRQFAMVQQMLAALCPAEWRDRAISKRASYYVLAAFRQGRIREARAFLASLITHSGLLQSAPIVAAELFRLLWKRISLAHIKGRTLVEYFPDAP